MDAGQVLQVLLSLGVVALALYASARLARRRLGPAGDQAMRVVARQAVSRTQNLLVVETNGHRHLLALTDGGAQVVDTWRIGTEASDDQDLWDEDGPGPGLVSLPGGVSRAERAASASPSAFSSTSAAGAAVRPAPGSAAGSVSGSASGGRHRQEPPSFAARLAALQAKAPAVIAQTPQTPRAAQKPRTSQAPRLPRTQWSGLRKTP